MSYRNYSVANSHQVSADGNSDFTTIQAAITAASSGQTVFVSPGTYTENLTLKAGVNITAFECDSRTPNVTIIGKMTATFTGTVTITGIRFQTNSDFIVTCSGAQVTNLNLHYCYINCTNNTAIQMTAASSTITIKFTQGNLTTTGIAYHTMTGGVINYYYCELGNDGASTTVSTNSAGQVYVRWCIVFSVFTTTSTGSLNVTHSLFDTSNTTTFTFAGTGGGSVVNSIASSGSASTISVGTGVSINITNNSLSSSNTNVLTGAGTIVFAGNIFPGSGNGVNTTTLTPEYQTIYRSSIQPAFMAYKSAATANVTGDGTIYTVICNTELFDQASNYNNGTGVFTAPYDGRYFFGATVQVTGITAAMTVVIVTFAISGSKNMQIGGINGSARDVNNNIVFSSGVFVTLTAAETVSLTVQAINGTKVAGINGAATNSTTTFYGHLVC